MAYFEAKKLPPLSFPRVSGSIVTFNSQYAGLPLKSHKVAIDSVSGVSAIKIQNTTGINQWDEVAENGYISDATGANVGSSSNYKRSANYILCKPETAYYFKREGTAVAGKAYFYDVNKNYITFAGINSGTTFTTPANAYYMRFWCNYSTAYNNDISINYPATDTDYHAFNGQSFTIQIGQTVNEGEYDARTGILEVTLPSVQTIQLPPCPIDTLEKNNIWADTGDTTLQYPKFG